MNDCCSIPHPLQREGTTQWERMPLALKEGYYKPDDRTLEQILEQLAGFATYIRYYDAGLQEWGRWNAFFDFLYDYKNTQLRISAIDELLTAGNVPPHLGLLLGFLKNYDALRSDFNSFTQRHLRFYYEDVLQLKRRTAQADRVVLLATPDKNITKARIPAQTLFEAGKDAFGNPLRYSNTREVMVNNATIAQLKTLFVQHAPEGKVLALHAALNAEIENINPLLGQQSWLPFGSAQNDAAQLGFAMASPTLFAQGGKRRISIEINTSLNLPRNMLRAQYSGPEGWVDAEIDQEPGGVNNQANAAKKFLLIKIDSSLPAIVGYNEKFHGKGFQTTHPVVKILLTPGTGFGNALQIMGSIKKVAVNRLRFTATGVNAFTLTGENGALNATQAFKPFGNFPIKHKSYFIIGCKEAFNKYLSSVHFAINWKAAPGNPLKYYERYIDFINKATYDNTLSRDAKAAFKTQWNSFDQGNVPGKIELLSGGQWIKIAEDTPVHYTVKDKYKYNTFHVNKRVTDDFTNNAGDDYHLQQKWGFAKVTLGYDFGHRLFPNAVAFTAMNNANTQSNDPLPPAPYTPEFNSLHLDYTLEANIQQEDEHQLYRIHPFGIQALTAAQQNLVESVYQANGYLFIGVAGMSEPGLLHLYFHRLDGSENIDALIEEEVNYAYLSGGEWKDFKKHELITNTTMGFSGSGFITFAIPPEALLPNSMMGDSLVWLRMSSHSSTNAYPDILSVYSNAIEATLQIPSDYEAWNGAPLAPQVITKPLTAIKGVKKIQQPYPSYGGKAAEEEETFHTRISERLRHKGRAVSIWDYERLLLQHFPQIFKVKCISHAHASCMQEAGNTLCVVLPSTSALSEDERLHPRLNRALLQEATDYLLSLNSPFASVQVVNPLYEEITIKCTVKMRSGYDTSFYAVELNKDLQLFICPWLADVQYVPTFGGNMYASSVMNFIEERPYIDYITHFEAFVLRHNGVVESWKESVSGSNERVILSSSVQHLIETQAIC